MWSHIYAPQNRSDIGVHPKKVQEVDDALKQTRSLVVLHGPSGCGKETVLRVLCAEKKWDVMEWTTQMVDNFGDAFLKFLVDARSTGSLRGDRRGRVVLVKDIPFSLWEYKEDFPMRFTQLLAQGGNDGSTFPIYFCVNDRLQLRLFPDAHVITFNPVAPTFLTKAIERLMRCANISMSKARIREIAQTSQGDLRAATNALQLGCVTTGAERLGLFHALGRLLYNKRLAPGAKDPKQLPHDQMAPKSERPPLYFEVEDVIANSGANGQLLVDFCFTNAPYFCDSLDDLADMQDRLSAVPTRSFSDVDLSHEVAIRGMLDANLHPRKPGTGLFQFVRPNWRDVERAANDRRRRLEPFAPRAIETDVPYVHQMLVATAGQHPPLVNMRVDDMQLFMDLHEAGNAMEQQGPTRTAGTRFAPESSELVSRPQQQPLLDDITDFDD